MKQTIDLFVSNGAWLAKHSDPKVKELFGTDTLTCPWIGTMSNEFVLHQVQIRNPDCLVRVFAQDY